ncbi:hypothetical protein LSH36_474g00037 [Paralvinella palmiformis]|uniref:Uncharacterized protein n=1 Tax=Paralvinella palmiformis TaxID=53620 RepID=A0AAD9J9C8_9ANNE|nr:hypothetical protein LSH36_474g00037 [Paralvinella palmiformis]
MNLYPRRNGRSEPLIDLVCLRRFPGVRRASEVKFRFQKTNRNSDSQMADVGEKRKGSVAERKIIIGVPVLPGLPLQSETTIRVDGSDSDSISSNQYEMNEAGVTSHGQHGPSSPVSAAAPLEPKWKMQHVDFIPGSLKGKSEDFERFSVLIDRANEWSKAHPEAAIFCCETVQWTSMDRPIFSDAGMLHKSMYSDKKSRIIRGLRLWYMILDDTFYDRSDKARCPGPFKLACVNYAPEGKNDNMRAMLKRFNEYLFKTAISGRRVLRVETLHQLADCSDPDVTSWMEQPEKSREYYTYFRIFFMFHQGVSQRQTEIGIRDFFPTFDQRSPHSQGYEVYTDMFKRAARWLYLDPHIQLINLQSVFIKVKKDVDGLSNFFERVSFKEHGSAYGSMGHTRTEYIQILRIVYMQQQEQLETATPKMMFHKHFSPVRVRKGMETQSGDDAEPLEYLFEDLRHVEQKINAWLSYSSAVVFGVETIPTRMNTGGQETIGPETTFCFNDREKNQSREYWKVNVRLYIEGRYKEIPVQWATRIVEERTTKT